MRQGKAGERGFVRSPCPDGAATQFNIQDKLHATIQGTNDKPYAMDAA